MTQLGMGLICLVVLLLGTKRSGAGELASADGRQAEITALQAQIAHHDELYFKKAAPEISDYDYDQLKRRLGELEKAAGASASGDDAAALGDDRDESFAHYRHRERMLSLDKSYSESDLRAFIARLAAQFPGATRSFVIEPKFDGLAISVTYEQGKLVRAVTRGNGIEGDDVTANLLALCAVPRTLQSDVATAPVPARVELRGEVYMTWAEFKRINAERASEGGELFAHPRNLAVGTLKQTAEGDGETRRLEIVFYGSGAWEPEVQRPVSQQELHAKIRAWGLPGVEKIAVASAEDEIWKAVQAIGRERNKLPYPIDGAVVKLDDVALQAKAGVTEHAPRWAMAYKFAPERVETELRAITWQVGRTGVLTPVAELATVQIGGSKISRATLHNRDEITRMDLRVGDFVYVEKAGEIIPAITGVDISRRKTGSMPFVFSEICPACRTKLVRNPGEVAVRCPNPLCPAQLRRRIEHFASKGALNIAGLGPAMIDKLIAGGLVKTIPDLYRLRREELLDLPGVGEKSAERLLAAIEKSRHAELWRVIHGLGIPRVGVATARELAKAAGSLATLAEFSEARLIELGVNENIAHETNAFFKQEQNRRLIEVLK